MKFALQHNLLQLGDRYKEAFMNAKAIGFDGVEVTHFGRPIDDAAAGTLEDAVTASGLPISAVCGGYRHWIGHFDNDKRLEAVQDIRKTMESVARFGGGGIIAPAAYGMFTKSLPPHIPPRDEQGDTEALLDSLQRIAEHAEATGTTFYLEPLNRYEDHMVNRVEQAAALVEAAGSSRLKVMADFYHMNIEEDDPAQTIRTYNESIGYYHLSDSNRYLPGEGHIDFPSLLQVVQSTGFEGYLSIECRIRGEALDVIVQSLSLLREGLYTKNEK
jgi:sugar phosphate isomerase/epimerase